MLEGRGSLLEDLLLPEVETSSATTEARSRGRERVRGRSMAPEDGDVLYRRIILAGLSHPETPSELEYTSSKASLHFPLKQKKPLPIPPPKDRDTGVLHLVAPHQDRLPFRSTSNYVSVQIPNPRLLQRTVAQKTLELPPQPEIITNTVYKRIP